MACSLLETCGRFLYRSPETTVRMANMLDVMMRLKIIKNLDPRHSTLVENAYYLCKPPEKSARVSKVRPPLHQVSHFYCYTSFLKLSYAYLYTEDDWCLECKHACLTWRCPFHVKHALFDGNHTHAKHSCYSVLVQDSK